MLSRQNRFSRSSDIKRIMRIGKVFKHRDCIIRYARNCESQPRFVFIVSKQISKLATQRNLIRRRLRACARCILPEIQCPYDIIVIARKGLAEKTQKEMLATLQYMFRTARIAAQK